MLADARTGLLDLVAPVLNPKITAGNGIFVEAILTCFLVCAVVGTAVDGRGPKVGGLFIGLACTMAIVIGGVLAGWIFHGVFEPS